MDDLDALLADLQTNLSKPQQHTTSTTVISTTTYPISKADTLKSTSPTNHELRNIYQNEDFRVNNQSQQTLQNGYSNHHSTNEQTKSPTSPHPHPIYQNESPNAQNMYRHETREEVRTETHSSGPNPVSTTRSTTNNLSELDSLLHDLNTTKHSGVLKDRGIANGTRPSVDSLLDELNSVGHSGTIESRTNVTQKDSRYSNHVAPPAPAAPTSSYTSKKTTSTVSASNATKELDDLMESLSDFKGLSQMEGKNLIRTDYSNKKELDKNTTISTKVTRIEEAPPRPPSPDMKDVMAVPPPRPPAPSQYIIMDSDDVSLPATLPRPPSPSAPLPTQSIIYRSLNQGESPQSTLRVREGVVLTANTNNACGSSSESANNRYCYNVYNHTDAVVDDPIHRPSSGGPVKRNDAEYRWVTDQIKHEVREVIEVPVVEETINASSLQSQVDTAYAKPLPKRRSPSPPPAPKPSPPNQLDCMLGSLTSHMTEQGVNTSQKGCCCACDKPIVGQVITALGKTWHPEHFTCAHCQQELGTKNFFEREGKPYCETDYHNLFSPKCAYCSGPILDKCVTALNKTWHPEHFFCAQCGNTFGDEGFHEKNGKPYCKEDYFNMFAPKCGGCNNPIMENYISALNSQWHPECFVCRDCHQPFNGGSFFDHEGLPYCETHYHAKRGSLCAGCNKPITGRCITAMFRKYHPEHFVCAFCLQQLNKGTFKEQNDKPYCHPCFDKLYG